MLEEKVNKDYIAAMKARDSFKSSTLNFLRAQLKNIRIDKRINQSAMLDDVEVVAVIKKQVKQRQDSIEQYKQGNREDLVAKESSELELLKQYLPQEMSEEELLPIIQEGILDVGASSMKDMGKVMKIIAPKVGGRADNKLISELVKKKLL